MGVDINKIADDFEKNKEEFKDLAIQKAKENIASGGSLTQMADDFSDLKASADTLNDEEASRERAEIKAKELKEKAKFKAEQAEKERIAAQKEKEQKEHERLIEGDKSIYYRYEWCLNKVGIRRPVPDALAYIGIGVFLLFATVYWVTIGPIIALISLALEQIGDLLTVVGKFLGDASAAARGTVKIMVWGTILIIVAAIIGTIILLALKLKGIAL